MVIEKEIFDKYIINSLGEVRNKYTNKVLKSFPNKKRGNYIQISLCIEGKGKMFKLHRLVAFAFPEICGEYFEGAEIDHINCDRSDNRAENLRWVDRKRNMNNPLTRKKLKEMWTEEKKEKQSEKMKSNNPVINMTPEWRKKLADSHRGFQNKNCWKKVACYTKNGKLYRIFNSVREACEEMNLKEAAISNTACGRQSTGGNYIWKYI